LRFGLIENKIDYLILTICDVSEVVYFELYQLLFHKGIFYSPGKEQIPVLEQISQFGMGDQQLPIERKQADIFFSDVLPSLKKVGEVDIDTHVESKSIHAPLQAQLYLTVEDDY